MLFVEMGRGDSILLRACQYALSDHSVVMLIRGDMPISVEMISVYFAKR
jgi:hypothetical protein